MRFHRCQNCSMRWGITMTMVGKIIFKRTHTKMYLPIRFSHGCFDSVTARRQFFLPCCVIKHALCPLEQADGSPHFRGLGSFLLFRTFHPR